MYSGLSLHYFKIVYYLYFPSTWLSSYFHDKFHTSTKKCGFQNKREENSTLPAKRPTSARAHAQEVHDWVEKRASQLPDNKPVGTWQQTNVLLRWPGIL